MQPVAAGETILLGLTDHKIPGEALFPTKLSAMTALKGLAYFARALGQHRAKPTGVAHLPMDKLL